MRGQLSYDQLIFRICQLEDELFRERQKKNVPFEEENDQDIYFLRLMQEMLDNIPDLIWAKDLKDRYLFANREVCQKILKCASTQEATGKTDSYFTARDKTSG